ncbi:MAG TPA: replication-associated recombination protein A [Gemmatimonadales bacterium]|nr:replication-associated recombination protein A [Gemmatimonadales bacterium]
MEEAPELFSTPEPLAARMRPRTLAEFVGQEQLLAPGRTLGDALRRGDLGSTILWGPPGTGKTSLAYLIAQHTGRAFIGFSAVTEGVQRVREIIKEAEERRRLGRGTILFCDEIHRFNRAQQDAFLPHVERGTVTLIGATTENPSFSLNAALLSRCQVFVLEPLPPAAIEQVVRAALSDEERGLGLQGVQVDAEALAWLTVQVDGDARRALAALEAAALQVGPGGRVTLAILADAMARRVPRYDQAGEEHFNLLSAYHKSLRGSDPQGALYWMARMLEGGEDPLVLFRRAIAMAAEDIGLADPQALPLAVAAREAFRQLGPPEGYLPLAEMTIYLATAPKSNSVVKALGAAIELARETPAEPVPLHLRNAPTALMKGLGYGKAYRYAHDYPGHYVGQTYLPDAFAGRELYQPGSLGYEKRVAERLLTWKRMADEERGG